MIDEKTIMEIESYMHDEDKNREDIIARSRIILKSSKSAIYAIHRKDIENAKHLLDDARESIASVQNNLSKYPHLKVSIDNALEEYCEAACFYDFVKNKKIPSHKELGLEPSIYLGGLSDLTGELGRKSVLEAIAKNREEVSAIRELVDEIYGLFARLDLRNGELRKKGDAIKWNLQKVEELLHDLHKRD